MDEFKHGTYRHFKGHVYRTVAIARHSETLEPMVVYVNVGNVGDVWVRPLAMFTDSITREGKEIKRFEFLE